MGGRWLPSEPGGSPRGERERTEREPPVCGGSRPSPGGAVRVTAKWAGGPPPAAPAAARGRANDLDLAVTSEAGEYGRPGNALAATRNAILKLIFSGPRPTRDQLNNTTTPEVCATGHGCGSGVRGVPGAAGWRCGRTGRVCRCRLPAHRSASPWSSRHRPAP
jgi:hypothetical protein